MSSEWATAAMVAAIALGCTIYYTTQAWFQHRERMAKIEKGIDPDRSTKG